jgi:hypothetical protein
MSWFVMKRMMRLEGLGMRVRNFHCLGFDLSALVNEWAVFYRRVSFC